jgi:hypothetical protein
MNYCRLFIIYTNSTESRKYTLADHLQSVTRMPKELNEDLVCLKLREWLRFQSIDDRRADVAKAHRDTFRWILSPTPTTEDFQTPGSDFVEWLRNGSGVYWIQGKMGCGKSTLMKYVTEDGLTADHLLEWANGQTLCCPSYYFSKIGTSDLQRSLQGLYRTLLATLIQHEKGLFRVAFPDWQTSDSSHEPTSAVLRDALGKILAKSELSCKYCFFIDGLDEYRETDYGLRGELAEDILGLARLSSVKLVVSSRPEPVFKLRFARCPTMKLHDLTRRDIVAYVDAELRRKALPQVLTSVDTDQLHSLCNEVIWKAEGVFLWVTIAVASILNGIVDHETFPELKFRLRQLNPKLKILFQQVLTDQVQASHRKQVARSLLAEGRSEQYLFPHSVSERTIRQAVIPRVDASKDYRLLIDDCKIDTHVLDLQKCLPGRSCGLYAEPEAKTSPTVFGSLLTPLTPLRLSHSSLYEFLNELETRKLLLEQAGDDFQVDEAIIVGGMAHLVCKMVYQRFLEPEFITMSLTEIVHHIEMAETSTGLAQTKLLSIFDEILGGDFKSGNQMLLAHHFKTSWDPLYQDQLEVVYRRHHSRLAFSLRGPRGYSDHGSDPLSLTIGLGYSCYLKFKVSTCRGLPRKAGTPLLFYPLWIRASLLAWVDPMKDYEFYYHRNQDSDTTLVKLLLAEGADPNERRHGITPWSVILHRIHSGCDDDIPLHRVDPPNSVTRRPEKSFLDELEVAKLMLEHGADPFLCMKARDTISAQIFAELLERQCCSGNSLNDCECAYARQIEPQLTELVELVKERRYQKQQMRTQGELLLIEAWLVVVLAYILQSCLSGFS